MNGTEDRTYNGWKNYETWSVALWLSNDEGTYNLTREMATEKRENAEDHPNTGNVWTADETVRFTLADAIEEFVKMEAPDLGATMYADLLNAALSEVQWDEIAANILSEV